MNNINKTNNKIFYINIMLKILLLISIIFLCLSLNKNKEGLLDDLDFDDGCKWVTPAPMCSPPSGLVFTNLFKADEGGDTSANPAQCTDDDENQNDCGNCGTKSSFTGTLKTEMPQDANITIKIGDGDGDPEIYTGDISDAAQAEPAAVITSLSAMTTSGAKKLGSIVTITNQNTQYTITSNNNDNIVITLDENSIFDVNSGSYSINNKAQWVSPAPMCDGPSPCPGKNEDDCGSFGHWTMVIVSVSLLVLVAALGFAFRGNSSDTT